MQKMSLIHTQLFSDIFLQIFYQAHQHPISYFMISKIINASQALNMNTHLMPKLEARQVIACETTWLTVHTKWEIVKTFIVAGKQIFQR